MTELSPEERANIAVAKHTILYHGRLLPVTTMLDNYGGHVSNPMRAFRFVAYDQDAPDEEHWVSDRCYPGEITLKREAYRG